MKRISILLLLVAFGVAACGGDQTADQTDAATATPTPTAEATEEPTDEPTDEPSASADAGGESALAELIPDELNGVPRTDIPGMDQFLASALQAQGLDAEGAEFVFASYGEGPDAVVLTAFRIPQVTEAQMEMLGRMLSGAGAQQGVEAETVDVAGKSVLRMTVDAAQAGGQEGVVYMYFAEGAAFTIVSPSADTSSVEALIAELP
jgi:hypothetical protein